MGQDGLSGIEQPNGPEQDKENPDAFSKALDRFNELRGEAQAMNASREPEYVHIVEEVEEGLKDNRDSVTKTLLTMIPGLAGIIQNMDKQKQ